MVATIILHSLHPQLTLKNAFPKRGTDVLLYMALSTVAVLSSCSSKELDRERAEEVIAKAFNYPNVVFREQQMFRNTEVRRGRNLVNVGGLLNARWVNISDLVSQGLVAESSAGSGSLYRYSLTQLARPFLKPGTQVTSTESSGFEHFEVKICNARIKEITGIRLNSEKTNAQVDYTVELFDFTPFLALDGQEWAKEETMSAKLELFDDGWRLSPSEKLPKEPWMSVNEFEAHVLEVQTKLKQNDGGHEETVPQKEARGDKGVAEGDGQFAVPSETASSEASPSNPLSKYSGYWYHEGGVGMDITVNGNTTTIHEMEFDKVTHTAHAVATVNGFTYPSPDGKRACPVVSSGDLLLVDNARYKYARSEKPEPEEQTADERELDRPVLSAEYLEGRWFPTPKQDNPSSLDFDGQSLTWSQKGRQAKNYSYLLKGDVLFILESGGPGRLKQTRAFQLTVIDELTMMADGQMKLERVIN